MGDALDLGCTYPDVCTPNLLPRGAVLLGHVQAPVVRQIILPCLRSQFVCFFGPQVSAVLDELPAGLTAEIIVNSIPKKASAQARSTYSLDEFRVRVLEAQAPTAPTHQAHLAVNVTTI